MKSTAAIALVSRLVFATFVTWGLDVAAQDPKSDVAPPTALSKDDEEAIRKTVAGVESAWNAHDMEAYGKLLRADVEWVNVVGAHWKGRDDVLAAHEAFHKTIFKNHRIRTDDVQIRPLCAGYAIAVVTTTNDAFIAPDGRTIDKRQDRQTYVLAKEPDGWKVVHCQNVWVDAEAAKHDPVNRKAASTRTPERKPTSTLSIALRLRRATYEDAYIAVPVTDAIVKPKPDGSKGIDPEAFLAEGLRIGKDSRVEWQVESSKAEPHPVQQAAPEGRKTLDTASDESK